MKVVLAMLESYYQNALALDYLRRFALEDPVIRRQVKIEVQVFPPDADEAVVLASILQADPHLVGFCCYLWNVEKTYAVARSIRTLKPDTILLLGGMEVTYDAANVLQNNPFADAVVQGEGEIPFREILSALIDDGRFRAGLPGVWWHENGNIHLPGPLQIVQNLDDIPSPFQSVDFDSSSLTGDILFESYRGCVFHCAFCLYHRNYTQQRYYSMERVKRDLDILLDSPCQSIRFVDSTFNIHPRRTKEILQILNGTDKRVSVEVSAEFFDEETVALLPRAGIRQIDIGLQSATKEALDSINRKFFREAPFTKNLALLRSHNEITLNVELIAGLPGDNYETFKNSIDFTIRQRPDHISIYRLLLLKGSELRSRASELGMRFEEKPPYTLIESHSLTATDLDRLELLSFSHIVLYNSGVATWALLAATTRLKVQPTDLYEQFLSFCLTQGKYSEAEMRELAHWYAVGNRFDNPRPEMFSLDRVRDVSLDFFRWLAAQDDGNFQNVYEELIDHGYRLARLDFYEDSSNSGADGTIQTDIQGPKIADHASVVSYSPRFFQTMVSLGNDLGEVPPDEAEGIAFFHQPHYGPTALILSRDLLQVLLLCDGQHTPRDLVLKLIGTNDQADVAASTAILNECLDSLSASGLVQLN
jgi:radical SAM superfamily enzyme YgiQ (UPF0313 family)